MHLGRIGYRVKAAEELSLLESQELSSLIAPNTQSGVGAQLLQMQERKSIRESRHSLKTLSHGGSKRKILLR